jgi:hypothetical protein
MSQNSTELRVGMFFKRVSSASGGVGGDSPGWFSRARHWVENNVLQLLLLIAFVAAAIKFARWLLS